MTEYEPEGWRARYLDRTSSEFPYEEVRQQVAVDTVELKSGYFKRYETLYTSEPKTIVTTLAHWPIRRENFQENHFTLQIVIEIHYQDGRPTARIDADYEIGFFSFLIISEEHFQPVVEDRVIPEFWSLSSEFLFSALAELDIPPHLLSRALQSDGMTALPMLPGRPMDN